MVDGSTLGLAMRNGREAESWKNYARQLEQELVNAKANLEAMRTLKDVAITELAKVEPNHPLMIQENRQKIINEAYGAYGKPKAR
ncbi:hypothetical protein C7410_109151 [Paraburkholderia silvatlantica]|uniref:Uncharacterized protein n=1 Tax=Paraburkholderia silvatlantica TaxID=321895 RepID=A0A2V4TBL5_9BURK|nr:hypothetical protein [Paraburkholderia silvatlantica]PYE22855.1 hypothetical protein C7410_109151 [Paraburkholderia silvatlantica]